MAQDGSTHNRENTQFGGSDKRYFPRWEVSSRVLCKTEADVLSRECRSRDINCAGASIYTDEFFQPNEKVKLTIYLDKDVLVRVQGNVKWTRPSEKQHLVGINFNEMSKKAQDLILKYAFELNKEKLSNHWFRGWGAT